MKATVREIRKILFDTDKSVSLGTGYLTNTEARDFFYDKQNQDEVFNVIERETNLFIF